MRSRHSLPLLATFLALAPACNSSTATTTTLPTPYTADPSTTIAPAAETTTSAPPDEPVELVLHNGHIITVDSGFSIVEALAIADGIVIATGTSQEILRRVGSDTTVIDLEERTVLPGFVDPHTHALQSVAPDIEAMLAAQDQLLRTGTTTTGAPHVDPEQLEAYREIDAAGDLVIRSHLYLRYNSYCGDPPLGGYHLESGFDRNPALRLAVAGVKIFTDGGACNAPAFSFEYPDTVPDSLKDRGFTGHGDLYIDSEEIATVVSQVDALGGITVIHAIGDVANRIALEGMAKARASGPFANPQRIDHNSLTSLLTPAELASYTTSGVTPVIFAMPWADACNPETNETWRSIIPEQYIPLLEDSTALRAANPGIEPSWHGDAPSLPGSPLQHMFSFVTRGFVDPDTGEICYPVDWTDNPTTPVDEVVRMMTINAAAAMGIDQDVGSLEPGKVADLVVLSENPMEGDPEEAIAANFPVLTMIDGEVVFCEGDVCEQFGIPAGEASDDAPSGWTSVDHPVVVAVRASNELESAAGVVDGNPDVGWVSGDDAVQWIELDLGENKAIESLRLRVDQSPDGFTVHDIFVGDHPDPGNLAVSLAGDTSWGDELTADIGATGRYLRVVTTESPSWVAWLEIEIMLAE